MNFFQKIVAGRQVMHRQAMLDLNFKRLKAATDLIAGLNTALSKAPDMPAAKELAAEIAVLTTMLEKIKEVIHQEKRDFEQFKYALAKQ